MSISKIQEAMDGVLYLGYNHGYNEGLAQGISQGQVPEVIHTYWEDDDNIKMIRVAMTELFPDLHFFVGPKVGWFDDDGRPFSVYPIVLKSRENNLACAMLDEGATETPRELKKRIVEAIKES